MHWWHFDFIPEINFRMKMKDFDVDPLVILRAPFRTSFRDYVRPAMRASFQEHPVKNTYSKAKAVAMGFLDTYSEESSRVVQMWDLDLDPDAAMKNEAYDVGVNLAEGALDLREDVVAVARAVHMFGTALRLTITGVLR